MTEAIRPMLAAKYEPERTALHLQQDGYLLIQPKIDGMRQLSVGGTARSRSGKMLPNKYLQNWNQCYREIVHGLDAEVVSGHMMSAEVFRESMSGIRSVEGSQKFTIYAFDLWNATGTYEQRLEALEKEIIETLGPQQVWHGDFDARLVLCPTFRVHSLDEIDVKEAEFLAQGWEGAILRRPYSYYKFNRATARGGELTKLKRFEDEEAVIIAVEPWYTNQNEATASELGFTVRSSHQGNLQPTERLGSIRVQLLRDRAIEFNIGVFRGVDHSERDRLWTERESLIGRIVSFKHQGYAGGYDVPRTPVLLSFTDRSVEF